MPNTAVATGVFDAFSAALSYPDTGYHEHVSAIEQRITRVPSAAAAIGEFRERMAGRSVAECQEIYTRTFDLNPQCTPLVSIHLFGEESFKRSRLMAGLRESYGRAGFDMPGELPDHMAVLLKFLTHAPDAERREISHYLLRTPLQKMTGLLQQSDSPYAHLLLALQAALDAEFGEKSHA